jgi:hypothetical protein
MEDTTMFTHLFNSREAAWYIYRKQFGRLPNYAWVIYMGPFADEEKAKAKVQELNARKKT